MSWSRFAKLLQTRQLDRDTKLMLINLISAIQDPKLEEEVFTFVFAWEEAEAQTEKQLIDGIQQIKDDYEEKTQQLNRKTQKELLHMVDNIERENRIEALKASIEQL